MAAELLPSPPRSAPLRALVDRAHLWLLAGDAASCLAVCERGGRLADTLGDHESARLLRLVRGRALLELGRPAQAASAAAALLAELHAQDARSHPSAAALRHDDLPVQVRGPAGGRADRQWRAAVLALQSAACVEAGDILAALDALAEALGIVERDAPAPRSVGPATSAEHRDDAVVAAADAVAGVLISLSLFEPAAALASGAAANTEGQDALAAAVLVRRLAQVHMLWAAQLELLGRDDEAAGQHVRAAGCAVRLRQLATDAGHQTLQRCAAAVEAFALERLGQVELGQARARVALAAEPRPDGVLEWIPGRVALARCAAHAGDLEAAGAWLEALDGRVCGGGRDVWAPLVQVATAEVATRSDQHHHPAVALWRDVAASATGRIWAERETRFADLRHRILRRELADRSARTARELLVDPLTGIGNRRRLEVELAAGPAGAVLFIDIDNFKRVNDLCGHAAGDDVLRQLAGILRACCRGGDVLVRYGGDEFVVVLRKASTAASVARRVLERVRAADWARLTGDVPVTVSVGAAQGREITVALQRSDSAMLAAKRAGRDGLVLL